MKTSNHGFVITFALSTTLTAGCGGSPSEASASGTGGATDGSDSTATGASNSDPTTTEGGNSVSEGVTTTTVGTVSEGQTEATTGTATVAVTSTDTDAQTATGPLDTSDSDSDPSTSTGPDPSTTSTGTTGETTTDTTGGSTTDGTTTDTTGDASTGEPIECGLQLKATIRDFKLGHPDFETYCCGVVTGLVKNDLGPDKKPVFNQVGNPKMLTDAPTFNQWYNTTNGVNMQTQIVLDLQEVMPGVYSYQNNDFFPIDNMLFGNEGNNHNFHFTTVPDTS